MTRPKPTGGRHPCCTGTISVAMLVAIIGGVAAAQAAPGNGNTFQLSAPRHQQQQQQQQHRQHQHHHHHHRHRKPTPLFGVGGGGPLFGGRNVSGHTVAVPNDTPWSSHSILLTANKTAIAEPKSRSSAASASASAAFSTGNSPLPLKLTLISASSSSSTSHSQVPRGESMATAVINHQAHQWWQPHQRPADRTPPAATAVATPNLRELQPATGRSTIGRHVCVDHQPAPITAPPMVLANAHPHSLFSEFWQHELFGRDAAGSTIPATRPSIAVHKCCPGWAQISRNSHGCTKPICQPTCQNGGKCVKPDVCSCPAGFHGRNCEHDRNECVERKPCDQFCHNTAGSFYCSCRAGFTLAPDGESCRRTATEAEARDSNAFEARDMENDVQPDYGGRVERMERTLVAERKLSADLGQKVVAATALVQSLKQRLESLEQRQVEVLRMRDQLSAQETQSRRLEYIVEQLYKCRSKNSVFCTLQ